jgi:hypothetical protein
MFAEMTMTKMIVLLNVANMIEMKETEIMKNDVIEIEEEMTEMIGATEIETTDTIETEMTDTIEIVIETVAETEMITKIETEEIGIEIGVTETAWMMSLF